MTSQLFIIFSVCVNVSKQEELHSLNQCLYEREQTGRVRQFKSVSV